MPETTKLELRTDTVEELIDQLETPSTTVVMPHDRRNAVADRLRRQTSIPDAVAFCGLPGAGKSYTAEKLGTVYDAPVISMGDAIRHKFKQRNWLGKPVDAVPDSIPSEELAEFAAEWREETPGQIPETVTDIVDDLDEELVIIDGVRSTMDYEVLNDYFDAFHLIEVKAKFYKRLNRLQARGRDGEEDFDGIDLAMRDDNEFSNLGFRELREAGVIDMNIKNGTGGDQLTLTLSSVVENNLPHEIKDGRPLGLDDKLEAFRSEEATPEEVREQTGSSGIS